MEKMVQSGGEGATYLVKYSCDFVGENIARAFSSRRKKEKGGEGYGAGVRRSHLGGREGGRGEDSSGGDFPKD